MVKIRLKQTGSRNRKQYRIIAIDESKRRDGRPIENLGYYNPLTSPPEIVLKKERIDYWMSHGAQLTKAVETLLQAS